MATNDATGKTTMQKVDEIVKSENFTAIYYGKDLNPMIEMKDGHERVWVPELKRKNDKWAGFVCATEDKKYAYNKDSFQYAGYYCIPSGKGGSGQLREFVDQLNKM